MNTSRTPKKNPCQIQIHAKIHAKILIVGTLHRGISHVAVVILHSLSELSIARFSPMDHVLHRLASPVTTIAHHLCVIADRRIMVTSKA